MDFSKMNQRITFLENRTVIDEIGNHTSKWDKPHIAPAEEHGAELLESLITEELS